MSHSNPLSYSTAPQYVQRDELIRLIGAAIEVQSFRFARQALLTWLAYFPGDLEARLILARVEFNSHNYREAMRLASQICEADPEYLPAWELLVKVLQSEEFKGLDVEVETSFNLVDCTGAIAILKGNNFTYHPIAKWSKLTIAADEAIKSNNFGAALDNIHQGLMTNPLPALVSIRHLSICCQTGFPQKSILDLATHYHHVFPSCQVHQLILAKTLIDSGEAVRGVAYLQEAASQDIMGQVITRLWGADHPYLRLWPVNVKAPISLSIPAEVSAVFGWNRLPENIEGHLRNTSDSGLQTQIDHSMRGFPSQPDPHENTRLRISQKREHLSNPLDSLPESLRSVQTELERIATRLKKNQLARADGRFPVYVILSTISGLKKQYGSKQADHIVKEMHNVATTIRKKPNWNAGVLLVDDDSLVKTFGLEPVDPSDPWEIKLLLSDLDDILEKRGEMIGAVLIVGGPEIVPYHQLPNPVDDLDTDVPSDNPYSTRDENYFIPEWPVGRLPGGYQNDATPLINLLKAINHYHAKIDVRKSWYHRLPSWLGFHRISTRKRSSKSWGYTAAIWRRASLSVFRPIGDPHALLVSPPVQVQNENGKNKRITILPDGRLSYFNLHGVQDAAEWFGQKDPSEPADHPDYPIALRPQDIVNGGRAPQIVFSEACYGAHIINKSIEEALALKFLASGSQCFIGSTCTSYGSITTPLIAADLLGHSFWKYVKEGLPCGEALRRAKIYLAKEMHRRQGFLDGEDQKTLISFVYFGDPLVQVKETPRQIRNVFRSVSPPKAIKTVCERGGTCLPAEALHSPDSYELLSSLGDKETVKQVKQIVQKYLPGILDHNMTIAAAHLNYQGNEHICPSSNISSKFRPQISVKRKVLTISKRISQTNNDSKPPTVHHQYLKVTLNAEGKITKLAISR